MKPGSPSFGYFIASLRAVLAAVLFVSVTLSASAEREALKLLAIGNSFSDYPTVFLPAMAKAGGKDLIYGRASIGGCSLERHARHLKEAEAGKPDGTAYDTRDPKTGKQRKMSLPELLQAQPWEIVTIQQASPLSFKLETYQPFADELIAAIHKYAPTAEIVVQETWAYREDHDFFKKGDFTWQQMYAELRIAYHTFADGKGYRIMPTGDAMNLARSTPRWTYVQDPNYDFKNPPEGQLPDQHTSLFAGWSWGKDKKTGNAVLSKDAIHTSTAGKYLGAVVWYLTIFDANDVPADYLPKDLSAEDAAGLRAHAKAAVLAERAREKAKK